MHTLLAILHVSCGILALLSGIPAMITSKGSSSHRLSGTIYYYSMIICGSSGVVLSSQSGNLILLLISFFTLYLTLSGKLYGRLNREGEIRISKWIKTIARTGTFLSAGLIGSGLYLLISEMKFIYLVPVVFGGILLSLSLLDLRHLKSGAIPESKQLILLHISRMGGSYIAAVTAFLVNQVHIGPAIIWWLLPGIVGGWIIRNVSVRFARLC